MLSRLRRRPLLRVPSSPSAPQLARSRRTASHFINRQVNASPNLHSVRRNLSTSASNAAIGGGFLRRGRTPAFGQEISEKEKEENQRCEREAQLKKEEEEKRAIEAQQKAELLKKEREEARKAEERALAEKREQVERSIRNSSASDGNSHIQTRHGNRSQHSENTTSQWTWSPSKLHRDAPADAGQKNTKPAARAPIGWQCSNCSFLVSSRHSVCGKCGTLKDTTPSSAPERESVSNQPASRKAFFKPHFSSTPAEATKVESPAHNHQQQQQNPSQETISEAQPQPKPEISTQAPESTIEAVNPEQPQITRGKLFGSVRVERPPTQSDAEEPTVDDIGLDPLEREIAELKVADPKYAQEIAEQKDWLREKRKRSGKKGQVVEGDPAEPEPYLTHSERRRRNKVDREYEERKRQQEKKEREAQKRRKEEDRKRALREAGEESLRSISLPEFISVGNLANALGLRPADFVKQLEDFGFEDVSYTHVLDSETASLIAAEFGYEAHTGVVRNDVEDLKPEERPTDTSHLPTRPPVITIMGHVDHGKTTLLDWLRKSSVVSTEHGGITQHIGAFSVTMPSGKVITFLDTPGHAAFLDMRRRGAEVTDIVILVVAANDSVKPQTLEAIKHAKEAGVPMIVALNKIDLPDIKPEDVKRDLANHGVWVEDIGGDVQCVPVSGRTGEGMVELEEAAVTLSEMLDHRAGRSGNVEGWLIEATTKKGGKVATVLVTRGTLRPGKIIVAGKAWARVRSLRDESGQLVKKALPGTPVEVDGWREAPMAGDQVLQAETEQRAKEVVDLRQLRDETKELSEDVSAINDARKAELERRKAEEEKDEAAGAIEQEAKSGPKGIPFLVKADVSGSVEAIVNSISSIGNSEVYAKVLRSGVGAISTSDIAHAAAANADIISFNMPVDPGLKRQAQSEGVRILDYNVIYEVMDQVTTRLSEHLKPNIVQRVTGEAEVGEVFIVTVKGKGGGKGKMAIAGCKITNGVIGRGNRVKVIRGKEVVYTGKISSLKNLKKDVTEMRKGSECGIAFDGFMEFKAGDQVQTYEEHAEKRTL